MAKIYSDGFARGAFMEFMHCTVHYNMKASRDAYYLARQERANWYFTRNGTYAERHKHQYFLLGATYHSACERWRLGIREKDYDYG